MIKNRSVFIRVLVSEKTKIVIGKTIFPLLLHIENYL